MTNETNIASEPVELKKIDMTQAVVLFFKNYFNFSGRASRSEFWWFTLAYFILSFACIIVDGIIFYLLFDQNWYENIGFLINIFSIATLIGYISLTSRRLQDIGRSGWWQMGYVVGYVPMIVFIIIGAIFDNVFFYAISGILFFAYLGFLILIIVWLILPPKEDENKWGKNPLLY